MNTCEIDNVVTAYITEIRETDTHWFLVFSNKTNYSFPKHKVRGFYRAVGKMMDGKEEKDKVRANAALLLVAFARYI